MTIWGVTCHLGANFGSPHKRECEGNMSIEGVGER